MLPCRLPVFLSVHLDAQELKVSLLALRFGRTRRVRLYAWLSGLVVFFVYRLGRPEQVGPGVVCVCLAYILNIDNKNPLEKYMSEESKRKAPTWFMVVAAILLVWNLLGVMAYVAQVTMTPEALAMLPDAQRQLYENTPAWATAAFAVAVNFGALGCALLLLKRNLAGLLLQLSLAGVLVQMYHSFVMSKSFEVFGPGGLIMPVMVLVLAIYLVILAAKAKAHRWTS